MNAIRFSLGAIVLPLLCLSASPLRAQTGSGPASLSSLEVEIGDAYEYEGVTRTEVDVHAPGSDSTQTVVTEAAVMSVMEVSDITDNEIIWEMSAVTTMANNMGGMPQQTPLVMNLTTDRQGRLKKMNAGGEENGVPGGELMSMMMSGSKKSGEGPGWFLPANLTEKKVGESWTESSVDTATITIMAGIDFDLIVSVTTTYTYGGIVDTLGVQAARLYWVVDKMQMDGSMDMSDAGMTMTMSGAGTGTGAAYYALQDRLLLNQVTTMVMDQDMDLGPVGKQSMKMRIYSEQGRQD